FVCAIARSPIAVEYARVHRELGLSRRFTEILLYSADATSVFTAASLIWLWGWTAPLNGNETRIFPGLTIMILVALGIAASLRRPSPRWTSRASVLCFVAACLFGGVAVVTAVHGPWHMRVGPIAASGLDVFKTLSLAAA